MTEAPDGPEPGDAFGKAMLDRVNGTAAAVIIERDDGNLDVDGTDYLDGWDERDRWVLDRAAGSVADIGAGAGRAAFALQQRGQRVTALDISPGAVQACRARGVRDAFAGPAGELAAARPGGFDSVLLLGNNLGLLASPAAGAGFLAALGAILRPGGVIAGTCMDPYRTADRLHLAYQDRNRARGRMAGQLTIRIRYRQLATGWFDFLLASPAELAALVAASGWYAAELFPATSYGVVLRRG